MPKLANMFNQGEQEPAKAGLYIEVDQGEGWTPYLPNPSEFCKDLLERLFTDWCELHDIDISSKAIEISVLMTDDRGIFVLNKGYRNKESATNVLSFPQFSAYSEFIDALQNTTDSSLIMLGDIALSSETIAFEAQEQKKLFPYHLAHMMLHGLLHLLGYDHDNDEDADIMESLEITMLHNIGIENPYAETTDNE